MKIDSTKLGARGGQVVDPMLVAMVTGEAITMAAAAQAQELKELPCCQLRPWSDKNHSRQPFRPYTQESLRELAQDIAENGVIQPVIVRPYQGEYQILAGHNRVSAAILAGLRTVPCIVRDVDDETAVRILTQTNLRQREKLLPSEKALAYKLLLENTKGQGKRYDLSSEQSVPKFRADDRVAKKMGEGGGKTVQRYIRLTYLIPELLDLVDSDNIGFVAGVSLSFLSVEQQRTLANIMRQYQLTKISKAQAEEMKTYRDELDDDEMRRVLDLKISALPRVRMVNIRVPKEMLPDSVSQRLLSDGVLLRRIAEVVGAYAREQERAV